MINNERGQFAIEGILIATLMMGLIVAGTKFIRDQGLFAKVMAQPTAQLSGMIESGVWAPAKNAKSLHPNQINRSVSLKDL